MIERRSVPAEDVAAAMRAAAEDAEPRLVPGARASLFHAFRIDRPGAARPERLQLFPYVSDEWAPRVTEAIALEVACWRAWWAWARRQGEGPVWSVAPLPGPIEEAVRAVTIDSSGATLAGYTRPWLEWPDLARAALPATQVAPLWSAFRSVAAAVGQAAGRDLVVPPEIGGLTEARRRVLTDGRTLVVTSWRALDPRLRDLEDRRPRTPS